MAIRPLTLGEILDRTVQLYRRNFFLFLGISTIPAAVDILISGGAGIFFTSRAEIFASNSSVPHPAGHPTSPADMHSLLIFFAALAVFGLVGVPILLGVFSLGLSAINFATLRLNHGETTTVRDSYRFGLRHFWRNLGILTLQFVLAGLVPGVVLSGLFMVVGVTAAILVPKAGAGPAAAIGIGLITAGAVLLLLTACVWIWIRYCLAFPASVSEDKKVWPAMQRAAALSKGTRGRIFVMYAMVAILTMVAFYALIIPLDLAMGMRIDKLFTVTHTEGMMPVLVQSVNLFVSFLERAFVMPIYAIALVLFYTDQRTRLEGYDIELLMAQAGYADLKVPQTQIAQPIPIVQAMSTESQTGTASYPAAVYPAVDPPEQSSGQAPVAEEGVTLPQPGRAEHE